VKPAAITGIGLLCGLGATPESFWESLCEGLSAVGDVTQFSGEGLRSCRVVEAAPFPEETPHPELARVERMALYASREALRSAGLEALPAGAGVAIGTGTGGLAVSEAAYGEYLRTGLLSPHLRDYFAHLPSTTADILAAHFAATGPRASVVNACSSSTVALGQALLWLAAGETDCVLAGAADALSKLTVGGFNSLRVVSPERPRPFDKNRSGMVVGEAAVFFVLETPERARARGVRVLALLEGYGLSSDAHHATQPHPEGAGALACLKQALDGAGVGPAEVDHVNAHGTATPANDAAEAKALAALLGERVSSVPVVSIKGAVGHCLGAAGAVEAAATVLALLHQEVPPNTGLLELDPGVALRVPVRREPCDMRHAVSINLAFGGNNAALVFGRAE
jgi:3-oxoacyl-[acyl-carrier-protein] synthase II